MPDFTVFQALNPAQRRALATFQQQFNELLTDRKPPRVSTLELCKELEARLTLNDGINEVPRSIINNIINYLEAESLNRMCPPPVDEDGFNLEFLGAKPAKAGQDY